MTHFNYLRRVPMVRMALMVLVPMKDDPKTQARITVTEQKETVLVTLTTKDGIERSVGLTLSEARKLSEHLNTICRRVGRRPAHQP